MDNNSIASSPNPRAVTNCVFYSNYASVKGGAISNGSSSPDITNCILWADTATASGNEIYNDEHSSPNVTYSYIEGIITGGGDPLFVNPLSGDFHLQPGSPCIDTGNNSAPSLPNIDFENDQRIIDGDLNGTPTVDVGVDEYTFPPSSVVWVDDDFTPGSAGSHTWGYDAFDNIRDGIYEVASPGTVHVAAGYYTENVNMTSGVAALLFEPDLCPHQPGLPVLPSVTDRGIGVVESIFINRPISPSPTANLPKTMASMAAACTSMIRLFLPWPTAFSCTIQ